MILENEACMHLMKAFPVACYFWLVIIVRFKSKRCWQIYDSRNETDFNLNFENVC